MGKTSPSTWKRRERQAAALFGARRQRLSGSSGRDDESESDSTHPRLFVETKTRANHAARTLYDETKVKAKKEGKFAVLALATKGRKGTLLCIHSDDLIEFAKIALESIQQPLEWSTVLAETDAANRLSEGD